MLVVNLGGGWFQSEGSHWSEQIFEVGSVWSVVLVICEL